MGITSFAIVGGVLFMAMPITIVGSSFANAWEKLQTKKLKAQVGATPTRPMQCIPGQGVCACAPPPTSALEGAGHSIVFSLLTATQV